MREWVEWLEPQIVLWDEIAASDAAVANAQFVANYLRGMVKELRERFTPSERWSGAASW